MQASDNIRNKRDWLMVVLLFVILGGAFLAFRMLAFTEDATRAHVFYGTSSEPIVTIDFIKGDIITHYRQPVPEGYDDIYPLIDSQAQTITLLGDFTVGGTRQPVVIRYDFVRRSVQVIEEQSPNNICSREGESSGWPLICLPNRVRIEFESTDEDFIV